MQQIQNHTTAKPAGRLLHLLDTIVAAKGGYLGDKLYAFKHLENNEFTLEPMQERRSEKLRWLILGREHYFETSKEYPIANKRELQRALRFDSDQAPFHGIKLQQIVRINEQSHRVTFWVIKPQLLANIAARPWLLLPESYLLAKALDDNIDIAAIERPGATLFVAKSGQAISSGLQSPYTPNLQHFAFSTGSSINADNSQYYPTQRSNFPQLLQKGLKTLSVTQLPGFLVKTEQKNWRTYPWKQAGIISATAFVVYLALSSGWLVYKQQQLQQQLETQSTQVNQALAIQKQFQQAQQWQVQLNKPIADSQPYWHIWPIILETLNTGARLSAVHYKGGLITLHGETTKESKATDILAQLAENSAILSAKFASPVKSYRGRERFSISFTFSEKEAEPKITEGVVDAGEK